eukprot:1150314-Pelagomonas_calceolata.AAC.9
MMSTYSRLDVGFSSAFDTTDHDKLLWIMYDLDFPSLPNGMGYGAVPACGSSLAEAKRVTKSVQSRKQY